MQILTMHRMKICIVTSVGGHLDEVMQLFAVLKEHHCFFVVNAEGSLPKEIDCDVLRIVHSERDWKLLINLWEAINILRAQRPDVIVSCGAGPAVPFGFVGKLLGIRVIFIETFAAVEKPTLTGRLMYHLSDLFVYQWKTLETVYPKGIFGGPIY